MFFINNKCVVVLGVHRSGTSTIAGILHYLGVNLGKRLLPSDAKNPKGYKGGRKTTTR